MKFCKNSLKKADVYVPYAEYRDTDGYWVASTEAISAGVVVFNNEDMFIPRRGRRSTLMVVSVQAMDDVGAATAGMTMRLDWSDDNMQADGLLSSDVYDHRAATDFATGAETIWHVTEPTIGLSSYSPSGTSIPGMIEVLRHNLAAANGDDIDPFDGLTFDMSSTDNVSSGWNTCANLADPTRYAVYNLSMYGTSLELDADLDWSFTTEDGTDCTSAPTELMAYASITNLSEVMPAGMTMTYSLYFDSTGASATNDDAIQFSVVDLEWYDDGYAFDGELINSLPLTGNVLMF